MPARLLIVDDESGIRESLGALLRDEGYEVATVASGEECLAQIEQRTFDLILLDVRMPDMDGFETATMIRSRKRSRNTPTSSVRTPGNGKCNSRSRRQWVRRRRTLA